MINMTVKGLPDKVYTRLKNSARLGGRSLNAQVIKILQEHAAGQERFERMRKSQVELEQFVASLPPMTASTPLIRQDRRRGR
jgi:plasmid stability protein